MNFSRSALLEYLGDFVAEYVVRGEQDSYTYVNAYFDSRDVQKESIFIALPGEESNGANFIGDAIDKGATCVLASTAVRADADKYIETKKSACDFLFVDDPLFVFGLIGAFARQQFTKPVIGVIGSVGKTTTKNMLRELLGGSDIVHASSKSFNNETGVPLTLCSIPETAHFAVIELGESHFGDLEYITNLARPDTLVITNVEMAHTEYLGDIDGVARTMHEAVTYMDEGHIFIHANLNEKETVLKGSGAQITTIDDSGIEMTAREDLSHDVSMSLDGTHHTFHVPLIGQHFVENAAISVAVAAQYGVAPDEIKDRMENVASEGHRMRLVELGDYTLFDDCYNANPSSMKASAQALVDYAKMHSSRSVFFMGPMRELGIASDEAHDNVVREICTYGIDILVLVCPATKYAYDNNKDHSVVYFETPEACCDELKNILEIGDVVAVKASRGPNAHRPVMYPVVESLENNFATKGETK